MTEILGSGFKIHVCDNKNNQFLTERKLISKAGLD